MKSGHLKWSPFELRVKVRGPRKLLRRETGAINKKIGEFLVGEGPKSGARSPVNSAPFAIFAANFGKRRASRGGCSLDPLGVLRSFSNTPQY